MERDKIYFIHIINEINAIEAFILEMSFEVFIVDKKTIRAVERGLEIIGEAAKNVSMESRSHYSDIPWQDIAGLRDKISHHYFDIDYHTLWDTIKYDLPLLKQALKK